MIDKSGIQSNGSSGVSDATIRSFLLGQLTAGEQSVFEKRLFTDSKFETRVRLAEFHLADDYARERLARAGKERFRQNFLLSVERNRMLAVSTALQSRIGSSVEPKEILMQRVRSLFDISQPAWRYAFAALILLVVFATVWLGIKEPQLVYRIIPKRVSPKPSATQTPQESHHPTAPSSPVHVETTPPWPAHEAITPAIVLNSKNGSAPAATLNPPKDDTAIVRVQLLLARNQVGLYRAELSSQNGEPIFSADSLMPADGSKINFDIPPRVLKTGDYQIRLTRTGTGSTAVVATYYLRVQ